jgi:hypothetical protein
MAEQSQPQDLSSLSAQFRSAVEGLTHQWGFVVVRIAYANDNDDAQWATALKKLHDYATPSDSGAEMDPDTFALPVISDSALLRGGDYASVRKTFNQWRADFVGRERNEDDEEWPSDVGRNVCIVIDEAALASLLNAPDFVRGKVPNHDFPITENLFDALRMLRPSGFQTSGRYLWVDNICIDQASDDEKGEQVWNMFTIYQKATQVVAWLGPAAEGVEDALTAAASTDYGGEQNLEKICAGLLHLYTRSWFTRMWVQQEIFAVRKLRLQCGPYDFRWSRTLSTPTLLWESQHLKPYIDAIRGSEEPPELPSELHSVYQALIKHIWEASRIGEDTRGFTQAQYNRTRPHYHYPVWYLIHRKDPQGHGREL